ncbi:MAG: hypothetical protein ABUS56_05305 [Acidobacteriota bacterium]
MKYIVLLCALVAVGCGGTTTTPAVQDNSTAVPYFYSGTMDVNGGITVAFTTSKADILTVTLQSVTSGTTISTANPPLAVPLGLAYGVASSDGSTCTPSQAPVPFAPGFTAQLAVASVPAGPTCVQVVDVGNLTGPVSFVFRVVHH